ncbi:MAG: hypothetical protein Q4D39_05065, partial [Coriobacteriaceae bacterium]|nr:hypothetical protein [Coriobacteriaceae bacterium]
TRYRIRYGEDAAGTLVWDGRGSFTLDVLGRSCELRRPDALERARQLGQGSRMLLVGGASSGVISTRREKDGLLGSCTFYALESGGAVVCGYPNPGGGRGWRMCVHRDGTQIALAKRPSEPVHTPDGFTVVAVDEDAAVCALLLVCYDVYASYLDSDGGAAGLFSFRLVNIFGTRAQKLDDSEFEARCEGVAEEDGVAPEAPASESSTDRAARIASRFAVKGDIVDRRQEKAARTDAGGSRML